MNENHANYAKIGFFVLAGFALLLTVIAIAGARVFSKERVEAETYFSESVAGLDVGSPVTYRGVKVGEVARIGFVYNEYGVFTNRLVSLNSADQILVIMALDPKKFRPMQNQQSSDFLARLVRDGLRVKVAALGVTGLSYLELDYFPDPEGVPAPSPAWTPHTPYIPSTPSTMFALKKAVDDTFVKISRINIQALGDEMLATLYLLQSKLLNADIGALAAEATALLGELRETNRSIQALTASPDVQRLPADLAATLGSARRTAATLESQVGPLTDSFRAASDRAARLADTLGGIATQTGAELEQTAAALNRTAHTLNRTAASQQGSVEELILNLRAASAGLDQLVGELRANPAALLFAPPPPPLPETRSPSDR